MQNKEQVMQNKEQEQNNSVMLKTRKEKESPNPLSSLDLWAILDTVHYTIARCQILELTKSGITREQARVLHVLKLNNGSATLKLISQITKRQHNSVSTLINRMEIAGLILKQKDPEEKIYKITITKKAEVKFNKATHKSLEIIFSALSPKQQQQIDNYLKKLRKKSSYLLDLMLK